MAPTINLGRLSSNRIQLCHALKEKKGTGFTLYTLTHVGSLKKTTNDNKDNLKGVKHVSQLRL